MNHITSRGPMSAALLAALHGREGLDALATAVRDAAAPDAASDVLVDEDLQLTLYLMNELHYGGLAGVDDAWEWQPDVLRCRAVLEELLEAALRDTASRQVPTEVTPASVPHLSISLLQSAVASNCGYGSQTG